MAVSGEHVYAVRRTTFEICPYEMTINFFFFTDKQYESSP